MIHKKEHSLTDTTIQTQAIIERYRSTGFPSPPAYDNPAYDHPEFVEKANYTVRKILLKYLYNIEN